MNKIITCRGKSIEPLTKEELITVLCEMIMYYESRLEDKDKIIDSYKSRSKKV